MARPNLGQGGVPVAFVTATFLFAVAGTFLATHPAVGFNIIPGEFKLGLTSSVDNSK